MRQAEIDLIQRRLEELRNLLAANEGKRFDALITGAHCGSRQARQRLEELSFEFENLSIALDNLARFIDERFG
jgi:hypothetical protein